ncbi:MAG: Mfa1 fimbrilin C-terminal domain-containing protein, partial [Muribaculaceae bacterium]|nr:Mfa1 fimbrilin C-terminal domain-containing protein [Muribaculaceae bacterium]
TYASLTTADVTFITALEAEADGVTGSETTTGRYVVYMQLTDDAKAAQWSYSNADNQDASELISGDDANAYLKGKFANVQIYNEGKTYYYFPIEHLGAEGNVGQYGVVRNHIYACAINTIAGLGTPVYDPDQTIYPEKPENEETYIAAKINILSWRVVNSNVDLNW